MSYDLCFWKQNSSSPGDHQATYARLLEEQVVEGLSELPKIEILNHITETFGEGWKRLDDYNYECPQGSFQVCIGPQYFVISSYSLPGEILNLFIDVAAEFGCKLFDPQVGERFEG
ncbi:MAG: hypothetical protein ACJ8C4_10330 [Gemmataceae bacterium]